MLTIDKHNFRMTPIITSCLLLMNLFPNIFTETVEMSVIWNHAMNDYSVVEGRAKSFISHFHFENAINETGWSYLEVRTSPRHSDIHQAYAAGFGEGLITRHLIQMSWHNTVEGICTVPLSAECEKLKNFIEINGAWIQNQIDALADTDPYWHQIRLFYIQLQGLIDGYSSSPQSPSSISKFRYKPDITGLLLLQIAPDIGDLASALKLNELLTRVNYGDRCTSLVKLTPENQDLYTAHNTFSTFGSMLRVLKKYNFGFHLTPDSDEIIPGFDMSFSSYPGVLLSLDDFYIMSSGIVAVETTIQNYNQDRWKYIKPTNFIFEGVRNVVANRLAMSAQQWCNLFAQFNSGTYNNQWTIVDYKRFNPGCQILPPGLVWVLEQMPGIVKSHDVTEVLQSQAYFGSYNIPYYPEIYNISGYPPLAQRYGDWFTYERHPRANIMRRDHQKVTDIESMTKLMRYNDYKNDPLSKCNCTPPYSAENAMSSRGDLNPPNGTYPFSRVGFRDHGGLDMKLTTFSMARHLEFIAISSPTYDQQPPFQWSKSNLRDTVSHVGHPDLWVFEPVHHKWHH